MEYFFIAHGRCWTDVRSKPHCNEYGPNYYRFVENVAEQKFSIQSCRYFVSSHWVSQKFYCRLEDKTILQSDDSHNYIKSEETHLSVHW